MSKINVQRIYNDIKKIKGEEKAKEFIYNMSNELQSFHMRLKNIMEVLISKYHHRLSQDTLNKLKEINELCGVSERVNIKNNNFTDNVSNKKRDINNFTSELTNKLDEIYFNNNENNIEYDKTEISNFDDDLWIPKELMDVSDAINEKTQELNLSFLNGIKSADILDNNSVLEIINKENDDVYLLNGKEISDEEFMRALKAKM
ncbi:hypothetical protein [Malacoplasma muris]|uniref:hypothetical protein n=1 Tax=Malacoplasma muris TaxID=2119 RepID=UPI00398EAFEF